MSPIIFNSNSEHLIVGALERSGDFKIEGQVIHSVKHADNLVVLAAEGVVLQGMIERLSEIGRCSGMEKDVDKIKVMRISRQPSPVQILVDEKQPENLEYLYY